MKIKVFVFAMLLCAPAFAQWQHVQTITPLYQAVLHASKPDTLYVGGNGGVIYRSFDGGQSFQKDSVDLWGGWLLDMQFSSSNIGYACGGTAFGLYQSPILKTSNAGVDWDTLVTNQFGYDLNCLHFIDDQTGFFGGMDVLVSTTDGGNTFDVDTLPTFGPVLAVHFFDRLNGLIHVNTSVLRTQDGGKNWTLTLQDSQPTFSSAGSARFLFPTSGQTGYYMDRATTLYKTTDGGLSWTTVGTAAVGEFLVDAQFVTPDVGYIATYNPMLFVPSSALLKTTDGGLSWQEQIRLDSVNFTNLSMVNAAEGYAMAQNMLFKTTNGGLGWGRHDPVKNFELFPNPSKGTVALSYGEEEVRKIILLDETGKEVRIFETERQLSLEGLSKGTYFLSVEFVSGHTTTKKLLLL